MAGDFHKKRLMVLGMGLQLGGVRSTPITEAITCSLESDVKKHPDSRRHPADGNHAYNRNKKRR